MAEIDAKRLALSGHDGSLPVLPEHRVKHREGQVKEMPLFSSQLISLLGRLD